MSHISRVANRAATNIRYVPRAQAHSATAGTTSRAGQKTASGARDDADIAHQPILKSPAGQLGVVALTALSIYAAYKALFDKSRYEKESFQDKKERLVRPDMQPGSTVPSKSLLEYHLDRPREGVSQPGQGWP